MIKNALVCLILTAVSIYSAESPSKNIFSTRTNPALRKRVDDLCREYLPKNARHKDYGADMTIRLCRYLDASPPVKYPRIVLRDSCDIITPISEKVAESVAQKMFRIYNIATKPDVTIKGNGYLISLDGYDDKRKIGYKIIPVDQAVTPVITAAMNRANRQDGIQIFLAEAKHFSATTAMPHPDNTYIKVKFLISSLSDFLNWIHGDKEPDLNRVNGAYPARMLLNSWWNRNCLEILPCGDVERDNDLRSWKAINAKAERSRKWSEAGLWSMHVDLARGGVVQYIAPQDKPIVLNSDTLAFDCAVLLDSKENERVEVSIVLQGESGKQWIIDKPVESMTNTIIRVEEDNDAALRKLKSVTFFTDSRKPVRLYIDYIRLLTSTQNTESNSGSIHPEFPEENLDLLLSALGENESVQSAACFCLRYVKKPHDCLVPALIDFLKSDNSFLRAGAASALARHGVNSDSAVRPLLNLFNDPSPMVQKIAIQSVASIKRRPDIVIPHFVEFLNKVKLNYSSVLDEAFTLSLYLLAEYGDNAKPAVPALVQKLREMILQANTYTAKENSDQAQLDMRIGTFNEHMSRTLWTLRVVGMTADQKKSVQKNLDQLNYSEVKKKFSLLSLPHTPKQKTRVIHKDLLKSKRAEKDSDSAVRKKIMEINNQPVLADLKNEKIEDPEILIRRLADKEKEIREKVRELLIKTCSITSKELLKALQSPNMMIRTGAAEILGCIGCGTRHRYHLPKTIKALEQALQTESESVRIAAAEAIWGLTGRCDKILPILREVIERGNWWEQRVHAIELVKRIGPDSRDAIPSLLNALHDCHGAVRGLAARTLYVLNERSGNEGIISVPLQAGRSENTSTHQITIEEAVELNEMPYVLPYENRNLLLWENDEIRKMGKAEYEKKRKGVLLNALSDHNIQHRIEAAEIVGSEQWTKALPMLRNSMKHKDLWVRSTAAMAVWEISGDSISFFAMIKEMTPQERLFAISMLFESYAEGFSVWVCAEDRINRLKKKGLTPFFQHMLNDPHGLIRIETIRQIKQAGPAVTGCTSLLRSALSDPVPAVREAAAQSLYDWGKGGYSILEALPELITSLKDSASVSYGAKAIQTMKSAGRSAVPVLMRLLLTDDSEQFSRIADTLISIGADAYPSVPILTLCIEHTNKDIREKAVQTRNTIMSLQ